MGGMSEQDILHVTFCTSSPDRTQDARVGSRFHLRFYIRPTVTDRGRKDMRKIQVLLPEEMISYLQGIVDSGETESMSQTIRKIIMKEMKANETQ